MFNLTCSNIIKMILKRGILRGISKLAKGWTIISLLFLYLLGSSSIETFHSLFHQHEATLLHTEQNEANPCHIALYHKDREGGCQHNSHLIEDDKCSFCNVQLHNTQIFDVNSITLPTKYCLVFTCSSFQLYLEGIYFQSAGRSPPAI
jgi:hypothetical protein